MMKYRNRYVCIWITLESQLEQIDAQADASIKTSKKRCNYNRLNKQVMTVLDEHASTEKGNNRLRIILL